MRNIQCNYKVKRVKKKFKAIRGSKSPKVYQLDFSTETIETRRQRTNVFKMLRDNFIYTTIQD